MGARDDGTRGELHSTELYLKEVETLRLLSQGYSQEEVASRMAVGYQTIKNRLAVIKDKLEARNTTHAVAIVKDRGLI